MLGIQGFDSRRHNPLSQGHLRADCQRLLRGKKVILASENDKKA